MFDNQSIPSSFRDPSGFLFSRDGVLYRQINIEYRDHYAHLMQSGLYETIVRQGLLVPHRTADILPEEASTAYKIIQPEVIPFISYPYEWCFSQLKDASLTTLHIQKIALQAGMSLKDASAFNIQFRNGKPILIDTLSFEIYQEGRPWIAYRQFCQHFLAPLALMAATDIRLNQLARAYIDGIPLDLASRLLPKSSWFRFGMLSHIHLHAKSQKHFADREVNIKKQKVSKLSLFGIIDSLENTIQKLGWSPKGTEWADYYEDTNYSPAALERKKSLLNEYIDRVKPGTVWDLGANTGLLSRIASNKGIQTISFDIDPAAVENNYLQCVSKEETHILPLILDLTNPSPSIGWANGERISLLERGPVDMVFVLALIHHLAISNNLPFENIAFFLSRLCRYLIIEFVPKDDSQVQWLLRSREDIFVNYSGDNFERCFSRYFLILKKDKITDSQRVLYLMEVHSTN